MSINILDLVKDQVTGALANQASSFLGESESGITKALGGMMPALLGGAIEKVSEPNGGKGVMDLIGGLDLDGLSDIAGLFGGGSSAINGLMDSGSGIVEMLLGSKSNGIIEMITGMTGMKSSSTGSLMKMAAPLLMGVVGKQIKGKGIGALTDLLLGQKDSVSKSMPSGMGNLLGFASLGNLVDGASDLVKGAAKVTAGAAKTAVETGAHVGKEAASTGKSLLKWVVPVILGLLVLGYLGSKGCNTGVDAIDNAAEKTLNTTESVVGGAADMTKDAANVVGDAVSDAAGAVGDAAGAVVDFTVDMAKAAFATVDELAKAALDKITFVAGSAGDQMMKFIDTGFEGDPTFRFKNLNFETGSSSLTKEAMEEVDNVAAIMKAYPKVNVEIHGHTDNTGDAAANKQLSSERAGAVMGRLIFNGIDAYRVKSMGYGQERPIADNNTEDGRASNRRIEIRLVK